jgi:signal transduction histidine kinase
MIGNVIDNAVQHTPERGVIEAVIKREGERTILDISDTGPGIPERERQRVFDRFYRREGNAGPGSGLGLAIVKRIADAHGAETVLSDPSTGTGLRIRFIFPRVAS